MTQTPHTPTPPATDPTNTDPANTDTRIADPADSAADPGCLSEVDRARRTATAARLRYANLAAAARATLAALADGDDPDPLGYLRDELAHPTAPDPPKEIDPGRTDQPRGSARDRGRG